jgi:D-alanyl-lipoteichoic acid acyltransferase DltB (MBOAT superfamily)
MLTIHCPCRTSGWETLDMYAHPVERTVLGTWCTAGVQYGSLIGAAFGATVTLVSGLWFIAYLGALVGGVIGLLVGLAVGAANGMALTLLATSRAWNASPQQRAHRAACTAVATTVFTFVCLQLLLFRSVTNQGELVFLDAPLVIGAAAAAYLTRRLPPVA